MQMHTYFADWYSEADPAPTKERLESRWQGVESLAGELDSTGILNLASLLYGLAIDDKRLDEIRQVFKEEDLTFPMKNNLRELEVLAGATLSHAMTNDIESANLCALAIVTGAFLRPESRSPASDILQEAKQKLSENSAKLRENMDLPSAGYGKAPARSALSLLEKTVKKHEETGAEVEKLSILVVNALLEQKNIDSIIRKSQRTYSKQLSCVIPALREETNILWWIFGERSRDQKCLMSELDPMETCLVAGKEMADLILLVPGPLRADVLLNKVITSNHQDIPEEVSLNQSIDSCDREWRTKWSKGRNYERAGAICSVHYAVGASLQMNAGQNWGEAYTTDTGIDNTNKIAPQDLAFQVYREGLLLKELSEWEDDNG